MPRSFLLGLLAAGAVSLVTVDADACGGCLNAAPTVADAGSTTQSGTVVTDHRMVLSLTGGNTTLWDQIEYAGDPEEFAWVLPIRGKVNVGVGSDAFVDALDQRTSPTIIGPRVLCNQPPMNNSGGGGGSSFSDDSSGGTGCGCMAMSSSADVPMSAAAMDASVSMDGATIDPPDEGVVIKDRAVVGPYQTVQISGTDSESIVGWLRRNNFEIPEDVEPILTKYVTEGFDFLAVRLRPGIGVHAMRPIRVTWPGSSPMLPLRMVAAGVAARVGIKLFVLGDGRWTTKNFAPFTIKTSELAWNFDTGRSNYTTLRADLAKESDDKAFAVESSVDLTRYELPTGSQEEEPPPSDAGDGGTDAADAGDAAPPASDIDVAFGSKSSLRVTRLRADLPLRHLNTDLELEADSDQSTIETTRRLSSATGTGKLCPFGVASVSTASTSFALVKTGGGTNEGAASADCAINERPSRATLPMVLFAALGLCALARKRR